MSETCDLGASTSHLRLENFGSSGATREPGPFFLKCNCSTGLAHVNVYTPSTPGAVGSSVKWPVVAS